MTLDRATIIARVESSFRKGALALISGYRRYISPYKGFRCAHHALHGKETCSEYGYNVFLHNPPLTALKLLWTRFKECQAAHNRILEEEEKKKGIPGQLQKAAEATCLAIIGCWCFR